MDDNPQNIFTEASFILLNGKQIPEQLNQRSSYTCIYLMYEKSSRKKSPSEFFLGMLLPAGVKLL